MSVDLLPYAEYSHSAMYKYINSIFKYCYSNEPNPKLPNSFSSCRYLIESEFV